MKALVLTGGGALGAYEAGVACGLVRNGKRFDLVCGTSIGAINAALTAQDMAAELEALWKSIASDRVITPTPQAQRILDFIETFDAFIKLPLAEKIERFPRLAELYMQIGPKKAVVSWLGVLDRTPVARVLAGKLNVNSLKASLIVTATNITQALPESFYSFVETPGSGDVNAMQSHFVAATGPTSRPLSNDNLLSAVEASSAIPFAFDPVRFNNATQQEFLYVDGGVANNTPIGLAIAAGATDITMIFMDPAQSAPPNQSIPNAAVLGFTCYTVMQQKILSDDLKLATAKNQLLRTATGEQRAQFGLEDECEVTLRQVRPQKPLDLSILSFGDQAKLSAAFDTGVADAARIEVSWKAE